MKRFFLLKILQGDSLLMKLAIKIIFLLVCVIPCLVAVFKDHAPSIKKYEEYIINCEDCLTTQKALNNALSRYNSDNSKISDVRDDDEFERIEKLLMDSGYLKNNYSHATKDCFFVINEDGIVCGCHGTIEALENNISSAKNLYEKKLSYRKYDIVCVLLGGVTLIAGLFF